MSIVEAVLCLIDTRCRLTLSSCRWNPHGQMIGKIAVGGTEAVANFAFVPGGMYIFHEYKLWKISIKAEGRTVRRDFGLY